MLYPIAIEPGDETGAWGVVVPDIKGCFSAGDTMDEAINNAKEAIEIHLETLAEQFGKEPPEASTVQHWAESGEYDGWIWGVVEIDTSKFSGKTERFNVTLPARLVARIDAKVASGSAYRSRSAFLAAGAEAMLTRSS